jgi:hypothetical protein
MGTAPGGRVTSQTLDSDSTRTLQGGLLRRKGPPCLLPTVYHEFLLPVLSPSVCMSHSCLRVEAHVCPSTAVGQPLVSRGLRSLRHRKLYRNVFGSHVFACVLVP